MIFYHHHLFYRRGNTLGEGEDLLKIPELESSWAGIPNQGSRPEVSSVPWKTTLLCRLEDNKENKEKLDSDNTGFLNSS